MEHLDEGTIHAWIDGALDTKQSGEIDAHVAKCPACSAAVAEARGLIAASSRILNALDDVPGGVVPKRVPGSMPAVAAPQHRRWRIGGWVPAVAAAALIVAVGLQVSRKGAVPSVAEMPQVGVVSENAKLAFDSAAPQQPAANAAQALAEVGKAAGGGAGPTAPYVASARARDMSAEDARRNAETRVSGVAAGDRPDLVVQGPTEQRVAPPSKLPAIPAPAAPRLEQVVVTSKTDAAASMKSAAEPTAAAAPGDAAARRASDRVSLTDTAAVPRTLAGCYRIEREVNESALARTGNVAGGAAKAVAEAARGQRSRAPAAAVAPAQAPVVDTAMLGVPDVVRLDTTARRLGLPVLGQRSDGVIGWWTRVSPDTANVRLLVGVTVIVTAKNRVTCPER